MSVVHVLFSIYLVSLLAALAVLGLARDAMRRQWRRWQPSAEVEIETGAPAEAWEARAWADALSIGPTAAELARAELDALPAPASRRRPSVPLRRTA